MLSILPAIREQIIRHAAAEYPRECCGILLGRMQGAKIEVRRAVAAKNLAGADRLHDRYVVDPLAILHAERAAAAEGLEMIGFYHSHPDHPAVPSATDLALGWPDYAYVIAAMNAAGRVEVRAWRLNSAPEKMREIPIEQDA